MTDRTGQQLGNYRLARFLGEGAFAEVYLGEHLHLGTSAAIKVLHAQLSVEDTALFRQEARIIAHLDHPNIVRVLDFGIEGGVLYLVMSYAPNGTLRARHPRGQRVPLTTVVTYVRQVASGLQFAHEQKIIHRDIKPENMLVGERGEILVSDFGIATVAHSTRSSSAEEAAGTVPYMAPEQITAHPRVASDQYSLAVVAYEWLCGEWPFQGTATEIAMKHYMAPVPPLQGRVPGLLPGVEQVILRALAKAPEQRFPTIQAFAQALEQASQGLPVPPAPPSSSPDLYQPGNNPYAGAPPPPPPPYPDPARGNNPYAGTQAPPPYNGLAQGGNAYPTSITPPPSPYTISGLATYPVASPRAADPARKKISRRGLLAVAGGLAGAGVLCFLAAREVSSSIFAQVTPTAPAASATAVPPVGPTATAIASYTGFQKTISSVAWSPDGKYIAAASFDRTARVWDARDASRPPLVIYQHHTDQINHIAWSPDGKYLATSSDDATVQIWKPTSGDLVYTYTGHSQAVRALGWSPDGKYIASGAWDKTVQVWEAPTGRPVLTYSAPDWVTALCWSPDGKYIASGTSKKIEIWHALAGGASLFTLSGLGFSIFSIAWSPDGNYLATSSTDSYQIWPALQVGRPLLARVQAINTLAWSPDTRNYLAGANADKNAVQIWQAPAGQLLRTCTGPTAAPAGVAWSPDSKYLVSGGVDKKVRIWQAS